MKSAKPSTKSAIVTGASRGLGLELATALADRGWHLVIDAREPHQLDRAARTIRERGPGIVSAVGGDISDPVHQAHLVSEATSVGSLELVVNNASTLGPSPLPSLAAYPIEALEHVIRVNFMAPLQLIQLALPHLRKNKGVVVDVTSDAAVEGYEGWGGYGSSKAALEQMSRVLAVEEPDIAVYWFDPGDMNTRMHQDAFPGEDISDRPLPQTRVPALVELIESGSPSGRYSAQKILEGSVVL